MKKLTLLVMSLVLGFAVMAQVPTELPDDFESYTAGMQLAEQNPDLWTTWSNTPGSDEDPFVTADQAASGSNSIVVEGINDAVLPLGDLTTGNYNVKFNIYVPSGHIAYYNILHMFDGAASEWGTQAYFAPDGAGRIDAGGEGAGTFTYEYDTWITVENKINLTFDEATIAIDGVDIITWQWSTGCFGDPGMNQLGAAGFYAWTEEGTPKFYIDDVEFIDLGLGGVGEPPVNLMATVVDDFYVELAWDAPGAAQSELLWDQLDALGETYGKSAQDFEAAYDIYDAEVTADFVLTEAATLNKAAFRYFYNKAGAGNVDPRVFNIGIFPDEDGAPGETAIYTTTTIEAAPDEMGVFEGEFVEPIALEAGTYWLGYNMQLDYEASGSIQCYAGQRAAIDNETPGYWRNPLDGFETGFTTWTQDIASQSGELQEVCFALFGAPATADDLANMNDFNNVVVERNNQAADLDVTVSAKGNNVTPANLTSRDPLGYNIYRNGDVIEEEYPDLNYYDGPLDPGTYTYLVTAVYPEGESAPAGPAIAVIDAGIPTAVISPHNALPASVMFPNTVEKNINISNVGTADLLFEIFVDYASDADAKTFAVAPQTFTKAPEGVAELVVAENTTKPAPYNSNTDREMLWDNAGGIGLGTSGLISGGYGGFGEDNNLVNCADDFVIPNGEEWTVEFIHTEGFTTEEAPVDPDGYGVIIYSDAFGNPGTVIYEEIVPWNNYESQDLALALPPTLGAGHYWLSVYAWFDNAATVTNHRWNWYYGTIGVEHEAVLQDEPGLSGGMQWTPIGPTGLGTDGKSMFFIIEGTKTATDSWLSFEPQSGTVLVEENTDVTVTFDPMAIADPVNGTYIATIKVFTNDPALPMEDITAAMQLTSVGIGEEESKYIAVYPNPAVDVMNIQSNENIQTVRVMNLAGQTIISTVVNAERYTVNASDLETGIYFVQIKTESGISTKKISVQ